MSESKEAPEPVGGCGASDCYTPGPWKICDANPNGKQCSCGLVWSNDGEWIVARANGDELVPQQYAANARLIAAAPELLEVLRQFVREAKPDTIDNAIQLLDRLGV